MGLNKYLLNLHEAMGFLMAKYPPPPDSDPPAGRCVAWRCDVGGGERGAVGGRTGPNVLRWEIKVEEQRGTLCWTGTVGGSAKRYAAAHRRFAPQGGAKERNWATVFRRAAQPTHASAWVGCAWVVITNI